MWISDILSILYKYKIFTQLPPIIVILPFPLKYSTYSVISKLSETLQLDIFLSYVFLLQTRCNECWFNQSGRHPITLVLIFKCTQSIKVWIFYVFYIILHKSCTLILFPHMYSSALTWSMNLTHLCHPNIYSSFKPYL